MAKLSGINHQRAVRAFEKTGFWIARQGKHITMTDGERLITLPRANPINGYTMGGIIKDAGLTIEEFKSLLYYNENTIILMKSKMVGKKRLCPPYTSSSSFSIKWVKIASRKPQFHPS